MNIIRNIVGAVVLAAAVAGSATAQMPMKQDAHKMHDAKASGAMSDGEVRRVDRENGKVTLRHGPIKTDTLDMEPMTMVFHVKDKAMLDGIKDGDKVKFRVIDQGGGRMTITEIKAAM
jgi:Cu(I)/Ag(I) efflux system protein CusF